jgi:hypothetical protein
MTNPDLERAARAIAVRLIPAYVNDAIWAEDLPMWRRRHERGGTSTDNPIGTARAALLAFLSLDDSGVERLARAAYFAHRGPDQYRPDHPNPKIAERSLQFLESIKLRDPDQWSVILTETRAVIAELRKMAGGEG